jgi:3'-phosphoadenosine 5'-phosphosulfate sulfotransferase (PAPS reductase)/FAD synthetase
MFDSHAYDDQMILPGLLAETGAPADVDKEGVLFSAPTIDINIYDVIIVCLSGGKDSIACLIALIEQGVDLSRVELWHHDVDGNEGSQLMDWPFMRSYLRKFAATFDLPLYFSWLEGGFEGEMNKRDDYSRPHMTETPEGLISLPRDTNRMRPSSRLRFPQQSASLQTRWCSSSCKIDVGRRALNNQDRFLGKKTLFITGERRDESSNRSKYNQFEPHHCDCRDGRKGRHVDSWRPVLHWSEKEVWDALARHRIIAPVPYRLGWSRSSCMTCIYNSPAIWATIHKYFPDRTRAIAGYEEQFKTTVSRKRINVIDLGNTSGAFEITDLEALEQAYNEEYSLPVINAPDEKWVMPAGAYGKEGCGAV